MEQPVGTTLVDGTASIGFGTVNEGSSSNSIAGAYSVQVSTNLVNWLPLGPATPRYLFTDTNATTVPQRFYR